MERSRIPYAHILRGKRRPWAGLVGRRLLGEPQDRLLNVSPPPMGSPFSSHSFPFSCREDLLTQDLSYSVRETEVPLADPHEPIVSGTHNPTDGGYIIGTELSSTSPLSTRERPTDHSPQTSPACSSPSELALPNLPCQTVLNLDATSNSAFSVPFRSENLPQPPPEVAALLPTQVFGNIVSPVLARSSPLVPWNLPSEIGYFWLGLFRISEVKVISMSAICQKNSL